MLYQADPYELGVLEDDSKKSYDEYAHAFWMAGHQLTKNIEQRVEKTSLYVPYSAVAEGREYHLGKKWKAESLLVQDYFQHLASSA